MPSRLGPGFCQCRFPSPLVLAPPAAHFSPCAFRLTASPPRSPRGCWLPEWISPGTRCNDIGTTPETDPPSTGPPDRRTGFNNSLPFIQQYPFLLYDFFKSILFCSFIKSRLISHHNIYRTFTDSAKSFVRLLGQFNFISGIIWNYDIKIIITVLIIRIFGIRPKQINPARHHR